MKGSRTDATLEFLVQVADLNIPCIEVIAVQTYLDAVRIKYIDGAEFL